MRNLPVLFPTKGSHSGHTCLITCERWQVLRGEFWHWLFLNHFIPESCEQSYFSLVIHINPQSVTLEKRFFFFLQNWLYWCIFCCSVANSCPTLCDPWTAACQASLSFTISQACSNSCPLSWWCYQTILPSVIHFSSCFLSFPISGSFLMSQFFASGSQSIRASASVLPMNIQDWLPLGWTGLISLQSKELSRVFSNTTVQKHQFFSTQPSLWSNSHIHMITGQTIALTIQTFVSKVMFLFKCLLGFQLGLYWIYR